MMSVFLINDVIINKVVVIILYKIMKIFVGFWSIVLFVLLGMFSEVKFELEFVIFLRLNYREILI